MSRSSPIDNYISQQKFLQAFEAIIQQSVNEIDWDMTFFVLEKLSSSNYYEYLYLAFKQDIPLKPRFKILKEVWKNQHTHCDTRFIYARWQVMVEIGNLQEAVGIGKYYIKYLLKRKNFKKGLLFFDEFARICKVSNDLKISRIHFYLLSGDYESLDKVLGEYGSEMGDALFDHFFTEGSGQWKQSQYLFEIIIEGLSKRIEQNKNSVLIREFVNLLYEFLVYYPNESFGIFYLLKYALISKNKSCVLKIKEVVLSQQERATTHFDYEKDIKAILNALDSMDLNDDSDATILASDFDFATDLIHGSTIRENIIKKLERDIAFFSAAGNSQKVNELKHKLKEIDSDNTLFFDDEVQSKKELLTRGQSLLSATPIGSRYDPIEESIRNNLLRSLKQLTDQELLESYVDLFYMVYAFEDLLLCEQYFNLLLDRHIESNKIWFDIEMFKIYCYQLFGQDRRVVMIVDALLQNPEISLEQRIELNYQKAEALFYAGKWKEAKKLYLQITNISPSYRLVSTRMWSLNEE